MWLLLFWPVLAVVQALSQGPTLPAIRRTPAGPEADRQANALHGWGTVMYLLPLPLGHWLPVPVLAWALACFTSRFLFDPVLNVSSGRPAGYVGETAWSDRALRRLAPGNPERLSLVLRLGVALGLGFWYFMRR